MRSGQGSRYRPWTRSTCGRAASLSIEPASWHPTDGRIFREPGATRRAARLRSLRDWFATARMMAPAYMVVANVVVARFASAVARTLRRAIGRARTDSDRR